jgi:NAD(P)H-nitrite reductase large subunit
MIKDGEKGVILQRNRKSYAVAPHIPCGVVSPDLLRKIADAAEKYKVSTLKITSAARIALIGIEEPDVDRIWEDLGMPQGHAVGLCVRSVKACPGTTFCRLGQQDSLAMGMKLDAIYHGMDLPSKTKIGVSGCNNQCAENCIKDIGLHGKKKGWTITAGGKGTGKPRLADTLAENLSDEAAMELINRMVEYYRKNAKKFERIGKMMDRIGLEVFKKSVLK